MEDDEPAKKKKRLLQPPPPPPPRAAGSKQELLDHLAAQEAAEAASRDRKRRLLAELEEMEEREKQAAEQKLTLYEELEEVERNERARQAEERRRATIRAEEVAAKVRERRQAEADRKRAQGEEEEAERAAQEEHTLDFPPDDDEEFGREAELFDGLAGGPPPDTWGDEPGEDVAEAEFPPDDNDMFEDTWEQDLQSRVLQEGAEDPNDFEPTPPGSTLQTPPPPPSHAASLASSSSSAKGAKAGKGRVVSPPSAGRVVPRPSAGTGWKESRTVPPPPGGPRIVSPSMVPRRSSNRPPLEADMRPVVDLPSVRDGQAGSGSSWRVLPGAVTIRDTMNLLGGKALGCKKKGACIKGRREGDWLALTDEPGFILIKRGEHNLLEEIGEQTLLKEIGEQTRLKEIPDPSTWKVDPSAQGTSLGNVVIADVKYTGTVKPFGPGAAFGFISSPEILEGFGKDVFVTINELEYLRSGQQVSFRIEIHKGKPQAFDIQHLDGEERGDSLTLKKTVHRQDGVDDFSDDEPSPWPLSDRMESNVKTTLKKQKCWGFQHGTCTRGDQCSFEHC